MSTQAELSEALGSILKDPALKGRLSKEQRSTIKAAKDFVFTNGVPASQPKSEPPKAQAGDAKMGKNTLSLKWGTLKSWHFDSKKGKKLLKEYESIGASMSAAMQNDTQRQKEIVCELIDLCDEDSIYLHWYGRSASKEEAKQYVMNYKQP